MFVQNNDFLIKNSEDNWLHFTNPVEIITTSNISQIVDALGTIEKWTQKGFYSAGFISYEAAPAFDPVLQCHPAGDFPLLWFGVYKKPSSIKTDELLTQNDIEFKSLPWVNQTDFKKYSEQIDSIKKKIADGATYQVNHTIRLRTEIEHKESPYHFFLNHIAPLDSKYSAYWQSEDFALASGSPELFFEKQGENLTSIPMKGTSARGFCTEDDKTKAESLQNSTKDQAENVMIVDMIRNDMGKIGYIKPHVENLFKIEKYSTVFQMTSTVKTKTSASLSTIFSALFPCASITGAPKVETMKIINSLEDSPREIYTGTIGFITPNNDARFSVAIRTASFDRKKQQGTYGVGGGIVWDSTPENEYQECKAKSAILNTKQNTHFQLIETLLYEPNKGIFLLTEHLQRLAASSKFFGFIYNEKQIIDQLLAIQSSSPTRIRLQLDNKGDYQIETTSLHKGDIQPAKPWVLQFSSIPVDSNDKYLYHKTTNRDVYNLAKKDCAKEASDVVLFNEKGEITETTICNIVVVDNGKKYTPHVQSGLLGGTFRSTLLKEKKITERIITVEELKEAKEIWLINSVRKWIPVQLPILD